MRTGESDVGRLIGKTAMKTELCRVTTNDGLQLDGALITPASGPGESSAVDALLLVHGTGGNFYSPGVLETFAQSAAADGYPVLRINTRGHDGMASIPRIGRSSTKGGAAYETVSQCVDDLQAWLGYLSARSYRKLALVGHSMGGVKALYFMTHGGHPAVRCVVGLSPPRFCHAHWMNHPQAEAFRTCYEIAREMVDEGRGEKLLSVQQPIPLVLTAAKFLDKYGPDDRYDYLPALPTIERPVLLLVGSLSIDASPAFDSLPAELEQLAENSDHLHYQVVGGADTMYSSCPDEPWTRANQWFAWLGNQP